MRRVLREAVEPVRRDAEVFAAGRIANIGTQWPRMRVGVTQKVTYVAPRQKGTRGRGPRRRPNLADLLMTRAMEPALEQNTARVERELGRMLDRVADGFN